MRDAFMSAVVELFGYSAEKQRRDWSRVVQAQRCPFLGKKCYKVRKSDPDTSIGSCTVLYGRRQEPVIICPTRLTERLPRCRVTARRRVPAISPGSVAGAPNPTYRISILREQL